MRFALIAAAFLAFAAFLDASDDIALREDEPPIGENPNATRPNEGPEGPGEGLGGGGGGGGSGGGWGSQANCGTVSIPARVMVQICGCDNFMCPPCNC